MKTRNGVLQILIVSLITVTGASAKALGQKLPEEPATQPSTPSTPKPPTTPATPTTPSASTGMAPLWEAKNADGKKWTAHVLNTLDTLGKDILDVIPPDAVNYCPRYNSLSYSERKQVWAFLMSAMVKYESNFNTNTKYTESFDDSHGDPVISRGLLQISIESANSYGCGFSNAQQLHDPLLNLSCGIRILNRWLDRDGRIGGKIDGGWKGGARYWSVLRSSSGSYQKIIDLVKVTSLCKR